MNRIHRLWTRLLLVGLLLLAGFTSVLAQDAPAGTVVALRGEVRAVASGGESRLLQVKGEIFSGDTIRTGSNARVQLLFSDSTIISLGAATVMQVDDYAWDPAASSGRLKTRVEEGTFRVLGGLITKHAPKQFATETPAATIGIRGSMYAGRVLNRRLQVVFLGGRGIDVGNAAGSVGLTEPGLGTSAEPGQAPAPPFKLSSADYQQLLEGLDDETPTGNDESSGSVWPGSGDRGFDLGSLPLDEFSGDAGGTTPEDVRERIAPQNSEFGVQRSQQDGRSQLQEHPRYNTDIQY